MLAFRSQDVRLELHFLKAILGFAPERLVNPNGRVFVNSGFQTASVGRQVQKSVLSYLTREFTTSPDLLNNYKNEAANADSRFYRGELLLLTLVSKARTVGIQYSVFGGPAKISLSLYRPSAQAVLTLCICDECFIIGWAGGNPQLPILPVFYCHSFRLRTKFVHQGGCQFDVRTFPLPALSLLLSGCPSSSLAIVQNLRRITPCLMCGPARRYPSCHQG